MTIRFPAAAIRALVACALFPVALKAQNPGYMGKYHQIKAGMHIIPALNSMVSVNGRVNAGFNGFSTSFHGAYNLMLSRVTRLELQVAYSESAYANYSMQPNLFASPTVALGFGGGFDFFVGGPIAPVGPFVGFHSQAVITGNTFDNAEMRGATLEFRAGQSHVLGHVFTIEYGVSGGALFTPDMEANGTDKVTDEDQNPTTARYARHIMFNGFVKVGMIF
jgi:hypothetical protein